MATSWLDIERPILSRYVLIVGFLIFDFLFGLLTSYAMTNGFNPILFIFSTAALLIFAVATIRPWMGTLAFLMAVPFIEFGKRLLFLVPPVSQNEYLFIKTLPDIVFFSVLLAIFFVDLMKRERSELLQTPLDRLIALYLLWNVIQILNPRSSLVVGLGGFYYQSLPVFCYYIGKFIGVERKRALRILKVTLTCGCIAAIYGYYQILFGLNNFEYKWLDSHLTSLSRQDLINWSSYLRVFSTFQSWKEFGFYLVLCCFIVVFFYGVRIYSILLIGFLLVPLAFTFSRASWLVLLLGTLSALWIRCCPRLRRWPLGFLLISPIFVPLIGEWIYRGNIFSFLGHLHSSFLKTATITGTFGARVIGWNEALTQWGVFFDPIGQGIGAMFVGARLGNPLGVSNPHNGFLDISLETGIVGLLLVVLIIIRSWNLCIRNLRVLNDRTERRITILYLKVGFGILVVNGWLSDYLLGLRPANIYFWLLLGIVSQLHIKYGRRLLDAEIS